MTLMTMISTATPKVTPSTEIKVMTETNVLLGRRYRSASSSSNGSRDMGGTYGDGAGVSKGKRKSLTPGMLRTAFNDGRELAGTV